MFHLRTTWGKPQFHFEETGWGRDTTQAEIRGLRNAGRAVGVCGESGGRVTFKSLMSSSPRSSRSSFVMQYRIFSTWRKDIGAFSHAVVFTQEGGRGRQLARVLADKEGRPSLGLGA